MNSRPDLYRPSSGIARHPILSLFAATETLPSRSEKVSWASPCRFPTHCILPLLQQCSMFRRQPSLSTEGKGEFLYEDRRRLQRFYDLESAWSDRYRSGGKGLAHTTAGPASSSPTVRTVSDTPDIVRIQPVGTNPPTLDQEEYDLGLLPAYQAYDRSRSSSDDGVVTRLPSGTTLLPACCDSFRVASR